VVFRWGKKKPENAGGVPAREAPDAFWAELAKKPPAAMRMEYPEDGNPDKLHLFISPRIKSDEKTTLELLGEVITARCRTARFTQFNEKSLQRDAIMITGAQAALDARTAMENGLRVEGYDEMKNNSYIRAERANPSQSDIFDLLESNCIPTSIQKDTHGNNTITISNIDPVVTKGVMSYLHEFSLDNEVAQCIGQNVMGVEVTGALAKKLVQARTEKPAPGAMAKKLEKQLENSYQFTQSV
jgi:hypothetical protein